MIFIILILSLSSCAKQAETKKESVSSQVVNNNPFVLARLTGEELHPILANSNTNLQLLKLCYDGLIRVNGEFMPEGVIATFLQNGDTIAFTIKDNAKFWDGSKITADDVDYSFKVAQNTTSSYSSRFIYVKSFSGKGSAFTVIMKNAAARNVNLFDIPIIKKNSDNNGKTPIGSGRYILANEAGKYSLKANSAWVLGGQFGISNITITDIADTNTLFHTFNSGSVQAVFSDLNSSGAKYLGDIEVKEYTTNVITFLGVNSGKDFLNDNKVRKAISTAINRQKLVSEALLSHAVATWHPFNPIWKPISSVDLPKDKYSKEEAISVLESIGFVKDNSGFRARDKKQLTISILVNNENSFKLDVANRIATELAAINVNASVNAVNYAQYNNLLNVKSFDLYVGEVKIPDNMDLTVLFGADANKGGYNSEAFKKAFGDYDTGAAGIDVVITAFEEDMPFIPLYYKNAGLAISRKVTGNILPVQNDLFGGIESWKMAS